MIDRSVHVDELADELGVVVRREQARGAIRKAIFDPELPRILVGGINTDTDYFTALHELGHHALSDYGPERLLEEEADAWQWAIEHAPFPPSAQVKRRMGECLRLYSESAKGARSRRPPKGHVYWTIRSWDHIYQPPARRRERRLP